LTAGIDEFIVEDTVLTQSGKLSAAALQEKEVTV